MMPTPQSPVSSEKCKNIWCDNGKVLFSNVPDGSGQKWGTCNMCNGTGKYVQTDKRASTVGKRCKTPSNASASTKEDSK